MTDNPRSRLSSAIEDAVRDAVHDFGHPQAVDTVGDAVTDILDAVDNYVAVLGEKSLEARVEEDLDILRKTSVVDEMKDIIRRKAEDGNGPGWKDYQ